MGLKALAEGKEINYEGASGPCDFTDIGDIIDCKFRYKQVDRRRSSSFSRSRKAALWSPGPAAHHQRHDGRHHPGGAGHRLDCDLRGAAFREFRARLARHDRRVRGLVANVNFGLPIVPSLASHFWRRRSSGWRPTSTVLKPFRAAGFITTAIGSIALTIALENVVRFIFGNELRGYDLPIQRDWRFERHPRRAATGREPRHRGRRRWRRFSLPRRSRAPARRCARSPTIRCSPASRASMPTWWRGSCHFVGMGLAGLGGMLIGLDTTIDPLTGFRVHAVDLRGRGGRRVWAAFRARWSAR